MLSSIPAIPTAGRANVPTAEQLTECKTDDQSKKPSNEQPELVNPAPPPRGAAHSRQLSGYVKKQSPSRPGGANEQTDPSGRVSNNIYDVLQDEGAPKSKRAKKKEAAARRKATAEAAQVGAAVGPVAHASSVNSRNDSAASPNKSDTSDGELQRLPKSQKQNPSWTRYLVDKASAAISYVNAPYPNIPHCSSKYVTGMAMGRVAELIWNKKFYDGCMKGVKDEMDKRLGVDGRPYFGLTSIYLGPTQKAVLVQSNALRIALMQTKKLTQAPLPGKSIGVLGAFLSYFGVSNIIMQTPGDSEYRNHLKLIKNVVVNPGRINRFVTSGEASSIIEEHLKEAEGNSKDLGIFFLGLALNFGGEFIFRYKDCKPSVLYEKNPAIFDDALNVLGDPPAYFNPRKMTASIVKGKERLDNFSLEMIDKNFDRIVQMKDDSFVVKVWNDKIGEDFPGSASELKKYYNDSLNDPAKKEKMEQFLEEVNFILIAVSETTAPAMNFLLRALKNDPDLTTAIRDEIDKSGLQSNEITLQNLCKLPLLGATVAEVLRQRPSVVVAPWMVKSGEVLIADVDIRGEDWGEDGILRKEKKELVCIPEKDYVIFDIKRVNESAYPDGAKFNAYRHLDENGQFDSKAHLDRLEYDQDKYASFSGASKEHSPRVGRTCTGRYLSWVEMTLAFFVILKEFNFHVTDEKGQNLTEVSTDFDAPSTIHVRQPLRINLSRRNPEV